MEETPVKKVENPEKGEEPEPKFCLYKVKGLALLRGLDSMPYRRLVFYTAGQTATYIIKDKLSSRVAIRHLFKDPVGVIAACSILE